MCQNYFGQELSLKIISTNTIENDLIDSIGYKKKHSNTKNLTDEVKRFSNQLIELGYLENEIINSIKLADTLYQFTANLGTQTKSVYIYVEENSKYLKFEKDTIIVPIDKVELFIQSKLTELELSGFSFATLKLVDFRKENNTLKARLQVDLNKKKILDEIVIKGYEKFPTGHKKSVERMHRKKIFNKDNVSKIYKDFNNFRFVNQTRYPEILFSEDSTKVYVYLEKSKSNRFDGYIGFANDEKSNLQFTGYLDLSLTNVLNSGEQFNLYWKTDDNKQVTFNANIEIPYVFKSPFGIKANLNIFKQDSIFQSTKTAVEAGYYFANNKNIFIGYQSTESSDIQNTNNSFISDFKSNFITSTFNYSNYTQHSLFPEKTKIIFKGGFGTRNSNLASNDQIFFEANISHDLHLNKNNVIKIKSENFYLKSNNYITNELYRFGGIRSIRGFNENSLQANALSSLLTEYRFILSSNLYINSVLDYAIYNDATNSTTNNLLGLGFGVGVLSKNGLLKLIYANGTSKGEAVKVGNSVVHLQFISNF